MGRAEDLVARVEQGKLDYLTLIAEAKHEELFLDFKQPGMVEALACSMTAT